MKLDRNINPDGKGKYALLNLRNLTTYLENLAFDDPLRGHFQRMFDVLHAAGVLKFGGESPGDQFFVMKYKDQFTPEGLRGYAEAINQEYLRLMQDEGMIKRMVSVMEGEQLSKEDTVNAQIQHTRLRDLVEYRDEILTEARRASQVANRMPD